MRELSVYYCSKCGYYGYYQLPKNAVCPKCSVDMVPLSISFQDFMDLSCEERDDLLSKQIISASSPYVKRLMAPHKAYNNREVIARMSDRIVELEAENKKLNETVEWMHQTIWDLVRKNKGIEPAGKSPIPPSGEKLPAALVTTKIRNSDNREFIGSAGHSPIPSVTRSCQSLCNVRSVC